MYSPTSTAEKVQENNEELILSPSCVVSSMEQELDQTLACIPQSQIPSSGPPSKLFVPEQHRLELISWAHTVVTRGHSGTQRTYHLLWENYWWPNLLRDVHHILSLCSTSAQSKVSRTLPASKLNPLPIPEHLWSHLSINLITDLPEFQGKTTFLIVSHQFSKSLHLIPMHTIPSAFTMAELLFQHVFRYFEILEEIVSDRGPQFTSRVRSSFMENLGITVNLTSGYDLQANSQVE